MINVSSVVLQLRTRDCKLGQDSPPWMINYISSLPERKLPVPKPCRTCPVYDPMQFLHDAESADVYVVRHGERIDEVRGNTWVADCGKRYEKGSIELYSRCNDPPLTGEGKVQANEVAVTLRDQLIGKVDFIYSSKLIRAVQTGKTNTTPLSLTPNTYHTKNYTQPQSLRDRHRAQDPYYIEQTIRKDCDGRGKCRRGFPVPLIRGYQEIVPLGGPD